MQAVKKKSPLDTLFNPEQLIKIHDGKTVKMRPIPVRRIGHLATAFSVVATLYGQGLTVDQIFAAAIDQVCDLIDECLVDKKIDQLGIAAAPFLLDAFLSMNLPEESLGKWLALFRRWNGMIPGEQGEVPTK